MRSLSTEECKYVAGGDNPGMGPYAAPVTSEICRAFADAQYRLIATGVAAGTIISAWAGVVAVAGEDATKAAFYKACMDNAAVYNTRNGYTADGSRYVGSTAGSSSSWNPSPTDMIQQAHNDLLAMMKPTGSNIP